MTASSVARAVPAGPEPRSSRLRVALGGAAAALMGAAPHVLHHVGPLAGTALVAGAGGTLIFGALGLVLTIPLLRRLRLRTGSWVAPGAALALMATLFTLSSLFVGPALTDSDDAAPAQRAPAPAEHEQHHE